MRLFGDWNLVRDLAFTIPVIRHIEEADGGEMLVMCDVGHSEPGAALRFGVVDAEYGRVAINSLAAAVDAIERGFCSALVTAPMHKAAARAAGFSFPGHTEYLAQRAGRAKYGRDYVMYFDSPHLRVALVTVHVPLTAAIASLTPELIAEAAQLVAREYERLYGTTPRVALPAVNPHAGEDGLFGNEEQLLAAAVAMARTSGVTISGPLSADTVFLAATRGEYDVVLALYHDQGLIPIKTLAFDQSVNVTLGLPYLRCSVDHGTAFDIAGRGIADASPMRYAIEWAMRNVSRFAGPP